MASSTVISAWRQVYHAYADAGRERLRFPLEDEIAQARAQALGDTFDTRLVVAVQQHAELVATQPRERVLALQACLEAQRDLAQHGVAGCVAAGIVDDLEAVEIEEQQRRQARRLRPRGQHRLQSALEFGAIDERRKAVVRRLPRQILDVLALARHVAEDQHEAQLRAGIARRTDARRHRLHRNLEGVAPLQQHVGRFAFPAHAETRVIDRIERLAALRVEQAERIGERTPETFAGDTPRDPLGRRIHELDRASRTGRDHRLADRTERRLRTRFTLLERIFDTPALQDQPAHVNRGQADEQQRRDEIDGEQQRSGLAERGAEDIGEPAGKRRDALVHAPDLRLVDAEIRRPRAIRHTRVQRGADLFQIGELGVASRPEIDRFVKKADVAEQVEGPDDVADIAGMDAARNQSGAGRRGIGRIAIQRETRDLQVAGSVDGSQIIAIRGFIAGFRIRAQVEDRVLLPLRPDAFTANVGTHRRHDVDAEDSQPDQDHDDGQKGPRDPDELRILPLRPGVHGDVCPRILCRRLNTWCSEHPPMTRCIFADSRGAQLNVRRLIPAYMFERRLHGVNRWPAVCLTSY